MLNIALPSASVVIGVPYSVPVASVLIKVAPTIGFPVVVPVSVTCNVRVPVADIVNAYVLVAASTVILFGLIVELSYPVVSAVTV